MTATNSQTAGRVIGHVISPERWARARRLMEAGFVHVTGLPKHFGDEERENLIQAASDQKGHWDSNNGRVVVITQEGEVWLAALTASTGETAAAIAPKSGAYVPCSNGETIHMCYILNRLADPYSDCRGRYSAIPQPR